MKHLLYILLLSIGFLQAQTKFTKTSKDRIGVALVLANGEYPGERLEYTVPNAKKMAEALLEAGYDVYTGYDLGKRETLELVGDFGKAIPEAGVGFIYYGGHGLQMDVEDYLIPVDADLKGADIVIAENESISLSSVLKQTYIPIPGKKYAYPLVLAIDACRNNPFWEMQYANRQSSSGRYTFKGKLRQNRKIIFSTTDQTKVDSNNPFARVLINTINSGECIDNWPRETFQAIRSVNPDQYPQVEGVLLDDVCPEFRKPKLEKSDLVQNDAFQTNNKLETVNYEWFGIVLSILFMLSSVVVSLRTKSCTLRAIGGMLFFVFMFLSVVLYNNILTKDRDTPISRLESIGLELVTIPSGSFMMGSNENDNEQPIHEVFISSFQMSRHEVTNAQFCIYLNEIGFNLIDLRSGYTILDLNDPDCQIEKFDGKFVPKAGKENHPVVEVSWYGAKAFCAWAGGRLPSESEWEYAARGGEGYTYAGSDDLDEVGWYDGNSGGSTHEVGQKRANGYGLYDMSGNIWEWCADIWHDNYKRAPTRGRAWTTPGFLGTSYPVIRGGSWNKSTEYSRVANRTSDFEGRYSDGGFRLAVSLP